MTRARYEPGDCFGSGRIHITLAGETITYALASAQSIADELNAVLAAARRREPNAFSKTERGKKA